jgi:predicted permease
MNTGMILLQQIAVMFILMGIGFCMFRRKMITVQGTADIGKILLYVAVPAVIINSFCIERTAENTAALLHSAVIAGIGMFTAVLLSYLIFGRKDGISCFSSAFSNAGFIGIPLVQAVLGSNAVFFISVMIVLINALQWTFGVFTMTGDRSVMSPKKIVHNPIVIAVGIGLIIYCTGFQLPDLISDVFSLISGLNTPLAMIVSGVYLAESDLVKMLKKKQIYIVSLIRLVLIPLTTILVFKLIPFGSQEIKLAIMIAAACPVGSNAAIFAQVYGKDSTEAVEQVCMSTILCLVTMPAVITLAGLIL